MYPTKRGRIAHAKIWLGFEAPFSPALHKMLPLAAEEAGRGEAAAHLKMADSYAMKRRNFIFLP